MLERSYYALRDSGYPSDTKDSGYPSDAKKVVKSLFRRRDAKARFEKVDGGLLEQLDKKFKIKKLQPYPKMFNSFLEIEHPPLICTGNAEALGDLTGWFRASGVPVNICEFINDLEHFIESAVYRPSLIVLDVDSIGGFEEVIDPAFEIRLNFPEVPVILISRDFLVNDFSTARLYIADFCLKHPPSAYEIEDQLEIAFANNRKWQDRSRVGS